MSAGTTMMKYATWNGGDCSAVDPCYCNSGIRMDSIGSGVKLYVASPTLQVIMGYKSQGVYLCIYMFM